MSRYALDNGLGVIILPDPSAPIFSLNTWFRVGSRNENPGRTGIAHLFEHLMFKATSNHPEGEFDRLMESRGASTNAGTWVDWTFYKETLGKNELDLALDLESDRMVNLLLDDDQLESERGVVENERRMVVDDSLMGTMSEELYSLAFDRHPYKWPTIGWMEDIQSISLNDCMDFYRRYYSPNNALLALVGDVDPVHAIGRISRYFGSLERQNVPQYESVTDAPLSSSRRKEISWPTPTAKILMGYRCPGYMHPASAALSMLNIVMFGGRSSRLYRDLVYESALASDVEGYMSPFAEEGLYEIGATLNPDVPIEVVESKILAALERVAVEGIEESELHKARNVMEAEFYRQLRTAEDRAYAVGFYETVAGDYRELNRRVQTHLEVSREAIRNAARRVFLESHRVVVTAVPVTENSVTPSKGPQMVIPTVIVKVPDTTFETEVAPGFLLVGETRRDLPVLFMNACMKGGSLADPPGKEGLVYMTGELLLSGAGNRSRDQLSEDVESLGGALSVHVNHDASIVAGQVLSRNLDTFLEIFGDVLLRPQFDISELEQQKKLQMMDIINGRDSDSHLVRRFFRQFLFRDHALGRPLLGWTPAVETIEREEVRELFSAHYRASNLIIAVAGDVDPKRLEDKLAMVLAEMPVGGDGVVMIDPPVLRPGRRALLVNKPSRAQDHIIFGHPCPPVSSDDFVALQVANSAFGGAFTSRLMEEIRIKRGWSYGAYSSIPRTRQGDAFILNTYTATSDTPEALALCVRMYEEFAENGITQTELEAARDYLANQHLFLVDTAEKRVGLHLETILKELDKDYFEQFVDRVREVDLDQVNDAVRRHHQTRDMSYTIVCNTADHGGILDAMGSDVLTEVVDYDWEGPLPAAG